jgi:hypothetical protein
MCFTIVKRFKHQILLNKKGPHYLEINYRIPFLIQAFAVTLQSK